MLGNDSDRVDQTDGQAAHGIYGIANYGERADVDDNVLKVLQGSKYILVLI